MKLIVKISLILICGLQVTASWALADANLSLSSDSSGSSNLVNLEFTSIPLRKIDRAMYKGSTQFVTQMFFVCVWGTHFMDTLSRFNRATSGDVMDIGTKVNSANEISEISGELAITQTDLEARRALWNALNMPVWLDKSEAQGHAFVSLDIARAQAEFTEKIVQDQKNFVKNVELLFKKRTAPMGLKLKLFNKHINSLVEEFCQKTNRSDDTKLFLKYVFFGEQSGYKVSSSLIELEDRFKVFKQFFDAVLACAPYSSKNFFSKLSAKERFVFREYVTPYLVEFKLEIPQSAA